MGKERAKGGSERKVGQLRILWYAVERMRGIRVIVTGEGEGGGE